MPAACAATSPRPACAYTFSTSARLRRSACQVVSVTPSMNSIATNVCGPCAPTS